MSQNKKRAMTTNEETQNTAMDVDRELSAGDSAADANSASGEVESLKTQNAEYLDRLARLQADFDNFRKRNVREQQEFREYALVETLKQLLPILDSLDRAAKSEPTTIEDLRGGVELIDRQFHDVLTRLGVEPIPAQNCKFDPTLHQAVQVVDTTEAEDGMVLDELARGYRLRDRVLRAAMVRVAQNPKL